MICLSVQLRGFELVRARFVGLLREVGVASFLFDFSCVLLLLLDSDPLRRDVFDEFDEEGDLDEFGVEEDEVGLPSNDKAGMNMELENRGDLRCEARKNEGEMGGERTLREEEAEGEEGADGCRVEVRVARP
eukprot:TRINITY_DN17268_c0_g1_i1.p2 TRINITY_DN17268_c0_g1~~TRINITY_DN17268_c0_g1_i1.p2  ORF type:complete len:132 (-),score=25.77 TRINITY_DN17268_c0_g1_i1:69-464(-)